MTRMKSALLALAAALLLPMAAQATPIQFTIEVTGVSAGTSLNGTDLSGRNLTITGYTLSDTEVGNIGPIYASVGQFAVVATFDFGGGSVFTSDGTSDITWIQNCGSATSMSCAGLLDNNATGGVFTYFDPVAVSDVNVGQAFAGLTPNYNYTTGFSGLTNAGGDSLNLVMGRLYMVTYIEASARSVPEPASLALLGIGLFGIGAARRRRQA